jgi:hypothetical protein
MCLYWHGWLKNPCGFNNLITLFHKELDLKNNQKVSNPFKKEMV